MGKVTWQLHEFECPRANHLTAKCDCTPLKKIEVDAQDVCECHHTRGRHHLLGGCYGSAESVFGCGCSRYTPEGEISNGSNRPEPQEN